MVKRDAVPIIRYFKPEKNASTDEDSSEAPLKNYIDASEEDAHLTPLIDINIEDLASEFQRKNPLANTHAQKEFESMSNILKVLESKRLITEEVTFLIEPLTDVMDKCAKHLSKRKNKRSIKEKFSSDVKYFAMTLNFYSPTGYKYVEALYKTALPKTKELAKFYENSSYDPGFNTKAFDVLRDKYEAIGVNMHCFLIVDDIPLEARHLSFKGIVNYGVTPHECSELASSAYTFMVVSMEEPWEIPVGYFLINSLNGEQRANLMTMCLNKCKDVGIEISAIVLEGSLRNVTAAELLGCRLKSVKQLKTYFKFNNKDVAIIFDVERLLSDIRMAFETKKVLYDGYNDEIRVDILRDNGFLPPIGTEEEVNYNQNFIKIFTDPHIAAALNNFNDIGIKPTVQFVNFFHKLHRILTSQEGVNSGAALFTYLEECLSYLFELQLNNRVRRLEKGRLQLKTYKKKLVFCKKNLSFFKLAITLESLKFLQDNLDSKVLPLQRCSLSFLEKFVYIFRQRKIATHLEPNVLHFMALYKEMLDSSIMDIKNSIITYKVE